ncbi:MAG: SUF system Fe-S cluster assembly regulator [Thermoplasmatota archaeon]
MVRIEGRMFRISRLTDYGILLLTRMAREEGRPVHNARDLADEVHIPQPTVQKLLKRMTRAGFLASQRGVAGGYALARDPKTIKVSEIIAALEGPIALTLCSEGAGACTLEHGCSVGSNMRRINDAITHALDGIDLAEIARPLPRNFIQLGGAA